MTSTEELARRIERLEQQNHELRQRIEQSQVVTRVGERARELVETAATGSGMTRRQALIALLGGGALVMGASGEVTAQANEPGAACTWLGDQNAAGYGLFGLGSLEGPITDDTEVTSLTGTGLSITNGVLNSTAANQTDWTPDGNSPETTTTQNYTYTLASNYDVVFVEAKVTDQGAASNNIVTLQVDGNNSSDYGGVSRDGSNTSNDTSWRLVGIQPSQDAILRFSFMGRYAGDISFVNESLANTGGGNNLNSGTYQGTTNSPAGQFTILASGGNLEYKVSVSGRDFI